MQQDLANLFWRFALALGLGLLVGLQRERVAARLAGLRTFPLVTLLGLVAGWTSPYVVAAAFLALGALVAVGYWVEMGHGEGDHGLTTEVTVLGMFGIGAYLAHGEPALAVSVGAAIAVLLQFKEELHGVAKRISEVEIKAMMQFALISMVILPALPDRAYGPYAVINPRHIWWMVVLIVAINLAAYLSYKFVDSRRSAVVSGLLGGLISSTATTASYARQARASGVFSLAALVILISSGVVFARILVEIAVAAPALLPVALPRLLLPMLALFLAAAAYTAFRRHAMEAPVAPANPAELKLAVIFGLGYSFVLLLAAAAKDWLGDAGLFAVAALSGLTDVDAITLSTAQLFNTGRVDGGTAWRVVLTALLSNMAFKLGMAGALAGWPLLKRVAGAYAVVGVAAAVLFWRG